MDAGDPKRSYTSAACSIKICGYILITANVYRSASNLGLLEKHSPSFLAPWFKKSKRERNLTHTSKVHSFSSISGTMSSARSSRRRAVFPSSPGIIIEQRLVVGLVKPKWRCFASNASNCDLALLAHIAVETAVKQTFNEGTQPHRTSARTLVRSSW
eukprot:TRINITY_DN850_c0_g1_i8.p2 TRINITY_DN850_c0_g1~~TRINITY_DN850_c0_g1_i8.p2  ORF type:complete len:157 (-),score=10.06 TRINITY_DN850_c0_g1_i8:994-1464(-)